MSSNKISTGLKELDNIIRLDDSDNGKLIALASRPGMGKSTLAVQIALNVAASSGKEVLFHSLESSEKQILERIDKMIQSYSKSSEKYVAGKSRIIVDDTPRITTSAIVERLKQTINKPALIVIDYIALMDIQPSIEYDTQAIAGELSKLSKELNIPILVLSQLPRRVAARNDKRPKISDLNIAEKSDIVIMLYRDIYYSNVYDENRKPDKSELIVAKNRFGKCGTIECDFNRVLFLAGTEEE